MTGISAYVLFCAGLFVGLWSPIIMELGRDAIAKRRVRKMTRWPVFIVGESARGDMVTYDTRGYVVRAKSSRGPNAAG